MEEYSDSDTSSESEYNLDRGPTTEPDLDNVDPCEEAEPEPSIPDYNEYKTFGHQKIN